MDRSQQFIEGYRHAVGWCVEWLHQRAKEMNDEHAKGILNSAAWNLGNDAKRRELDSRLEKVK